MKRFRLLIKGTVQGVGFRPFVNKIAKELNVKGYISNTSTGVLLDIETYDLDIFLNLLKAKKPPLCEIYSIDIEELALAHFIDFKIIPSFEEEEEKKIPSIPPDMGICENCLKEFNQKEDRRYKYPFINCTNCGPRYSIVIDTPYDRKNTTMRVFDMCEGCKKEYTDISNRRYHAEAICCPNCGPKLYYVKDGVFYEDDVFKRLKKDLENSKIIALKGLGGFHLICNALDEDAVKSLRLRKKRSSKPFAVMFKSLEDVLIYTYPTDFDLHILNSIEKPIILIKRKEQFFKETTKGLSHVGAFLPYTGIHLRVFDEIDFPIIATSGNISDTPICKDNIEAFDKLKDIVDAFLIHNRDIQRSIDDSVVKPIKDDVLIIRYARSFAPKPIYIKKHAKAISLGIGAFLKSTIAIYKDNQIILSQHIGDLDSIETFNYYKSVLEDFLRFYNIKPDIVVCDMHPDFPNTKYAKEIFDNIVYIQHHKAHIYSVIAEHNIDTDILGIAWDGIGYGEDKTIWGGEFFVGKYHLDRVFHIKPYKLIGLDKASKNPKRIFLSFLFELFGDDFEDRISSFNIDKKEAYMLYEMWKKDINTIYTSSVGRLFDMIAYITNLVDTIDYEAKGAMMVEDRYIDTNLRYDFEIKNNQIDISPMVLELLEEKDLSLIPSKFINTLFEIIKSIMTLLKAKNVVLSGGVFYNKPLLLKIRNFAQRSDINLYYNQKIPIGDGGISVGQAFYGGVLC